MSVEKEVDRYLRQILPPKTDFYTVISLIKREDRVDVSVEITIRSNIKYHENHSRLVKDAINHAKRIFYKLLDDYLRRE